MARRRRERAAVAEAVDGTVARILRLLGVIAETPEEISVKALAQRAALPPSTIHRLLQLLIEGGFVDRAPGRRYRMGAEFFRVARLAVDKDDLARAAHPFMRAVVDACDETCLFGVYRSHDHTMSFAARIDCSKPLRYRIRMHGAETLVWGASGHSILAFLPEAEQQAVIAAAGPAPSDPQKNRADARAFIAELQKIRQRGYATSHGERIEGAVAVSAPVFGAGGRVVGSLTINVPEFRYVEGEEAKLARVVTREAAALSRALGNLPAARA